MSEQTPAVSDERGAFMAFYDDALPRVYGYLSARCPAATAEELTSEVFLAAVDTVRRDASAPMSIPWAIGVARHKLVDHWRRQGREERGMKAIADSSGPLAEDPWDARIDQLRARSVLDGIGAHHRVALCLRYLDGLSVPEVASELGRTVHATEALLVRARAAFRRRYENEERADA